MQTDPTILPETYPFASVEDRHAYFHQQLERVTGRSINRSAYPQLDWKRAHRLYWLGLLACPGGAYLSLALDLGLVEWSLELAGAHKISLQELRELFDLASIHNVKEELAKAFDRRHFEVVKFLMEGEDPGVELTSVIQEGFAVAVDAGETSMVKFLLKDPRCDPNKYFSEGRSCLAAACRKGYAKIARHLLRDGRVDPVAAYKTNILEEAIVSGYSAVVKVLLEDGRIDPATNGNFSLDLACADRHLDIIQLLLQDGRADPTHQNSRFLRRSCEQGHSEVVRLLLEDGRADPTVYDPAIYSESWINCFVNQSFTSMTEQHYSTMTLLIRDGRTTVRQHESLLRIALESKNKEILESLLEQTRYTPHHHPTDGILRLALPQLAIYLLKYIKMTTSYFDWLSLDLQQLILEQLPMEGRYRFYKSGCISRETLQLFYYHRHQMVCTQHGLVASEQHGLDAEQHGLVAQQHGLVAPAQHGLDYFFIVNIFTYLSLASLPQVKQGRNGLKKLYLEMIEEPMREFNPDALLASELYLLKFIDQLPPADFCRHLLPFYELDRLIFPQVSERRQEILAEAILSCEGLSKPFGGVEDNRPILATWEPYQATPFAESVLKMIGQLIESCPLSGWLIEELIRLQAPFWPVFSLLISQGNSYLTKVFLRRWCAARGNSLEGIFNYEEFDNLASSYRKTAVQALELIVDLFEDNPTLLRVVDLQCVYKRPELMKKLLDLPGAKTYQGTLSLLESLRSFSRTTPEFLVQRLYDFLLADESLEISHVLHQITRSLSKNYWSLYEVVPKLCQLVVARSFSEDQNIGSLRANFLNSSMASGLFDLLLVRLPLVRLKEILADYNPRRAFFPEAPTTREALNRILALRPEAYEGFKFTIKLEEVPGAAWYEVIMKCETLRRQYGLAFLIRNYSSLKTVKLSREYEDLWVEAFPLLYRKALITYHQELLSFLKEDAHYAKFQITLPEDY